MLLCAVKKIVTFEMQTAKELFRELYKDHHDTWEIIDNIENQCVNCSDVKEQSEKIITLWKTELAHHFIDEEQNHAFPFIIKVKPELETEIKKLLSEHDEIIAMILQLFENKENKKLLLEICKALKQHIQDEEKIFTQFYSDPYWDENCKLEDNYHFMAYDKYKKGGEIESLISKGILELKFYETTPKHAKEYGIEAKKPLYVQNLCVPKNRRLKEIGKKVLNYIEDYARKNGNDVIFGYVSSKASFTKDSRKSFFYDVDVIKNWLHDNGYAINQENNDFHKVVKFDEGGLVLLAPNGKRSNLTAEQHRLVRTPEFKAWFGDWENDPENASKVIDSNGEPLVCYHGTTFDFTIFKVEKPTIGAYGQGFYFSNDKDFASNYAKGINGKILNCFLNIKNIFIINDDELPSGYEKFENMAENKGISRDFTKKIILENFSGVLAINRYNENEYVVFEPTQIKLADGSNTTFDSDTDDIRFTKGGSTDIIQIDKSEYKYNDKTCYRESYSYNGSSIGIEYCKGQFFKIYAIKTDESDRRKGYATKLLEYVKNIAKDNQFSTIQVNLPIDKRTPSESYSLSDYDKAVSFFTKNGFKFFPKLSSKMFFNIKETYKQGGNLSKTPAPKSERIYGSKVNKPKSAESMIKAKSIILNPKTIASIESILEKHNKSNPNKKIPLETAKAVVRRGMGAYSVTHRPTITDGKPNSRVAWGLARLNAFIYKIQKGHSKSGNYMQDNDLINELGYKVEKFVGGGSVLLAPNGKPSNLTAEQYKTVRTPEFKKWFGDWENDPANASKVVDENGEPLVVYHGSRSLRFFVFDINKGGKSNSLAKVGFWFTPISSFAVRFAENSWWDKNNVILYSVFLSIKNPKIYKTEIVSEFEIENLQNEIKKLKEKEFEISGKWAYNYDLTDRMTFDNSRAGRINEKNIDYYSNLTEKSKEAIEDGNLVKDIDEKINLLKQKLNDFTFTDSYQKFRTDIFKIENKTSYDANVGGLGMALDNPTETIQKYRESLKEDGYDGIVILKTRFDSKEAGGLNDQFIALYPEQIKLAHTMNTTFDANNPDIRFNEGGKTNNNMNILQEYDLSVDKIYDKYLEVGGAYRNIASMIHYLYKIDEDVAEEIEKQFFIELLNNELPKKLPTKKQTFNSDYIPTNKFNIKPIKVNIKPIKSKSINDLIELFKDIVSDDELRPAMTGVYLDSKNNTIVGTDAHKLIEIKYKGLKESKIVDVKSKKEIDAKYPDYKVVIPKDFIYTLELNLEPLIEKLAGIVRANKFFEGVKIFVSIQVDEDFYLYNALFFYELIKVFLMYGYKTAKFKIISATKPLIVENEDMLGLIMPIMSNTYSDESDNLGVNANKQVIAKVKISLNQKIKLIEKEIVTLKEKLDRYTKNYEEADNNADKRYYMLENTLIKKEIKSEEEKIDKLKEEYNDNTANIRLLFKEFINNLAK